MDYQNYSEDVVDHFSMHAALFLPDSVISKFPKNSMAFKPLELENKISGSFRFGFIIFENIHNVIPSPQCLVSFT